jgi:hypothetical protein
VSFVLFVFVRCRTPKVANVSGLSIHDCPFGFLYRLFFSRNASRALTLDIYIVKRQAACVDLIYSKNFQWGSQALNEVNALGIRSLDGIA